MATRKQTALTRAQQQQRNQTSARARQANTQFRTAADSGRGENRVAATPKVRGQYKSARSSAEVFFGKNFR
ncbi:MAG: hypothetical protein J6T12_10195 [Salinivirgaceae bacterium]|nr:hypothetical protein [Salinivirgaceae bacterium]